MSLHVDCPNCGHINSKGHYMTLCICEKCGACLECGTCLEYDSFKFRGLTVAYASFQKVEEDEE